MCLFTNCSCYSALYHFDLLPFFSSQPSKVTICGRHEMASVRDMKIDEALLVLCLAYYVMKRIRHCRAMAFTYRDMGCAFTSIAIICIFRNGWMDYRDTFDMLFFACVTNATKLSAKQTGLSVFS